MFLHAVLKQFHCDLYNIHISVIAEVMYNKHNMV